MTLIRAAEAPRFEVPGVEFTGLAAPSRGSAELCTWRITVAPRLELPEPHTIDRDEVFMVTAGTIRVTPGGDLLSPGDAAVVPAGNPILLSNPAERPAEAYVVIGAGFVATAADGTRIDTPPWAR